jgi:prolyl-tRNA editing enzyme YbaK/EbsC (Cys-tRNA(Pro) deacylase)
MSVQAGLAAVTAFLERQGVPYEVVDHEPTQTAAAEARAARMPPARVAKTVVLRDQEGCASQ